MAVESLSEVVYGSTAGTSMFGSMLSSATPYIAIASMIYGGIESQRAHREQIHQQEKLTKAQLAQSELIREKIKADNAELFSAARSAAIQTSGSMGAIY